MSIARQLNQLQEVDLELESCEQALARAVAQIGESPVVVETRQALERETAGLEELRRQQHEAEWAVDDYTTKITTLEEKLYSGRIGNPKELANLQHEIEVLKAKRSQLEDRTIAVMEQVEGAKAGIETLKGKLKTLEAEWQAQQAELKAEREHREAELVSLKQKREMVSSQVDSGAVDFYVGLKEQKGTAVARVEQGVCRGCRISLSNAEMQRARGNALVQCSSCGRILFLA